VTVDPARTEKLDAEPRLTAGLAASALPAKIRPSETIEASPAPAFLLVPRARPFGLAGRRLRRVKLRIENSLIAAGRHQFELGKAPASYDLVQGVDQSTPEQLGTKPHRHRGLACCARLVGIAHSLAERCAILRRMDHVKPRPAGTSRGPRRVEARERALVEWVANASSGDPMPEPWRWAHKPTSAIIVTLVDLGVVARPAPGVEMTAWKGEASAAARVWLQAHPAEGGSVPGSQ